MAELFDSRSNPMYQLLLAGEDRILCTLYTRQMYKVLRIQL
jgi:hypothetical protein